MDTLLEVKNLKKYFKTPTGMLHAVDNVSFAVEKGKTLGIVGESGCGKSTLGRVILNLIKPTSGQIIFDGQDVTNMNSKDFIKSRPEMQIIFQDPFSSLNPKMCVEDIIAEPLVVYKKVDRIDLKKEVAKMMDIVGLASRLARSYPHELDGGRRQRIGIARALILNPKFVVCDEPVSALDVSIQAQILNLLMDLQDELGLTYMFITHNLSVVKHISDDICVMYLGNIVEKCSSDELFKNPLHPYTKALLSAIPKPAVGSGRNRIILRGELSSPIEPPACCRFVKRCITPGEKCDCVSPAMVEVLPGHFVACNKFA